jgi:hypothetical protein
LPLGNFTLFSFLFGWGFALQMSRAEARGARFLPFYSRRLFVLLLIGLANWIVLDWDSTLCARTRDARDGLSPYFTNGLAGDLRAT